MSSAEHEKRLADIRKGSQIEAAWDRKQNKHSIFSSEGSIMNRPFTCLMNSSKDS